MTRNPDELLLPDNPKGIEKVTRGGGDFAFFMESTTIEYLTSRRCELRQVGGQLDTKSYGVALPQGSPLRAHISSAIIKLNEQGTIARLKAKWWEKERGGGACLDRGESGSGNVSELNLQSFGGIFIVLAVGLVIGILVAILEKCWSRFIKGRHFF